MSKDEGSGGAGATSIVAAVSVVGPAPAPVSGSAEKTDEVVFNIGDVINGYTLIQKIDEGGFGQVFKVTNDEKTFYAMKLESNSQEGGSAIKLEMNVLGQLPKKSVFPDLVCGGRRNRYHYLVLELLGDNLKMLKARSPNPEVLTDGTWSRLGIQCMFALKTMHDRGFVHRDVKPSNFAIGLESRSRVVLLFDFGLARKFIKTERKENSKNKKKSQPKGRTIPKGASRTKLITPCMEEKPRIVETHKFRLARPHTDFRGTHQYASPNAHAQLELGRHDDIWSLMYMIAECFLELPWTNNDDLPVEVLKGQSPLLRLFTDEKNLSHFSPEQYQKIKDIDKMIKESNYYSHPNYEMVYNFLKEVMTKAKVNWEAPYDWELTPIKLSSEMSRTVKKTVVEIPKIQPWMEPGDLFKNDNWRKLDKPVLKSAESAKPAPKPKSGSKPKVKKGKKDRTKVQEVSREEISMNMESTKKDSSAVKAVDTKKEPEKK